jgi:hypothetical protein
MDPKWKLRLTAGVMALVGVAGSILHGCLPWHWASELLRDLSVALFVAGLLAVSVDVVLKTELAKDVFNAAFSYFLPDELKQEIRRIIEYKFLCVKHHMALKLLPIDGGLFRLEIKTERTIRNISNYSQKVRNSFAVDEWGKAQKSGIEICTLKFGNEVYEAKEERDDLNDDAIGLQTVEVSIGHNEEVTLVSVGHEIKDSNSEFFISFNAPTVNPVVNIEMPPGFKHSFSFGVPGQELIKSSIAERYEIKVTCH